MVQYCTQSFPHVHIFSLVNTHKRAHAHRSTERSLIVEYIKLVPDQRKENNMMIMIHPQFTLLFIWEKNSLGLLLANIEESRFFHFNMMDTHQNINSLSKYINERFKKKYINENPLGNQRLIERSMILCSH